jgi:iron complex transport system ATP-binding protein
MNVDTGAIDIQQLGITLNGRTLLEDVSLHLRQGEVLALLGPNGAGKSTLLRAVAGDLPFTRGRILLHGAPIDSYHPRDLAMRRAVLPQQTVLQFAFTAREVVEMGRGIWSSRHTREQDDAVIRAAMERTETDAIQERTYPTLSGGEQARVTLARVLSQEAPILLLDEPTAALDLSHQQMVMEIAREIAQAGGAVMTILHDINLAAAYADRLAILHQGRMVSLAEPWEALNPELLSEVFDCPIAVARHPMRNCPLVLPMPKSAAHMQLAGKELTISSPIPTVTTR